MFTGWITLFGLLPVDHSKLTLISLSPGSGFVAQSPMGSMKLWRLEPRLGCGHLFDALTARMNRESYNLIAPQWAAARAAFFGRERDYLDAVLATAPTGATVLDLGCGTGRPMAEHIVAQGRRVLGVDQAEALLEIARVNLPSERWVLSTMQAFEPDQPCHGALLWDSLFHVPRTEHEPILRKVVSALPSGARLMLTVGGSAHPAFTDTMFGQTFSYDSNTPEESERILARLGCRIVVGEFMNWPDGGRNKGRYAIVAEKSGTEESGH